VVLSEFGFPGAPNHSPSAHAALLCFLCQNTLVKHDLFRFFDNTIEVFAIEKHPPVQTNDREFAQVAQMANGVRRTTQLFRGLLDSKKPRV